MYEALILGLKKAIDIKVSYLKVIGDSKIITQQVCNTIHYLSPHLKGYQQEVWHFISTFDTFDIKFVPKMHNAATDILANAVARFTALRDGFSIEIVYKPALPDNVTNLHIFYVYQ